MIEFPEKEKILAWLSLFLSTKELIELPIWKRFFNWTSH